MKKIEVTKTTKVVGYYGEKPITAHITEARLKGKHYALVAVSHYTLEGCGLTFRSVHDARVHATLVGV